jgi:hypothetical protein
VEGIILSSEETQTVFQIIPQAPNPVFSPPSGNYTEQAIVMLSLGNNSLSSLEGIELSFAVDQQEEWLAYNPELGIALFQVNSIPFDVFHVYAQAHGNGYLSSAIVQAEYVILTKLAPPQCEPSPGHYYHQIQINCTCSNNSEVYYMSSLENNSTEPLVSPLIVNATNAHPVEFGIEVSCQHQNYISSTIIQLNYTLSMVK